MSAILGISAFHPDSSACLLIDGRIVGAVAEERLGRRIKHSDEFPAEAIRWLLTSNGLRLADLDIVAFPHDPGANRLAKAAHVARHPATGLRAAMTHMRRTAEAGSMGRKLAAIRDEDPASARFETVTVEHHLAHIASAYYCSPFDGVAAGFSYDGSGDFASMMAARCEGNRIEVLDKVRLPHSLGFFYTALCQFIGFDAYGEEYKVMGLAPYGEDRFAAEMRQLVSLRDDGWFVLSPEYFVMHRGGRDFMLGPDGRLELRRMYSDRLADLLGPPARRGVITQREMDIARSVQARFEEAAMHCLARLHRLVPSTDLAMAGGCALNGVANARALRETPFKRAYLQPAASDDGTALGAALWAWHNVAGGTERFEMAHAFWGPGYDAARIQQVARAAGPGIAVEPCASPEAAADRVAELIAAGQVVGWYQGRGEWGPRALGNRSILADPAVPTMKDTINAKIKRRESFRPFAPSVLREDVATYFEQDVYSPFMMHVVKLKPEWRERMPAIAHVDGTGRLQSVDAAANPLYHRLIAAVKRRTGIGVVLNTSFNENEPVVDTPEQALACFLRTDMDALGLGRFVLTKSRPA
jgi:carbamoyltransferase